MKTLIVAACLSLGLATVAFATSPRLRITSDNIKQNGERVEASNARIDTSTNDVITAESAAFTRNKNKDTPYGDTPYVVELRGAVKMDILGSQVKAKDGARYYPEVNTLVAGNVVLSGIQLVGPTFACVGAGGNMVQATYPNGTVITAQSVCGGGMMTTCSGGVLLRYASSC